jgi:hypothetical protein
MKKPRTVEQVLELLIKKCALPTGRKLRT